MSKPATLFVSALSECAPSSLQAMHQHHGNYYTRLRVHSVLLSSDGWSVGAVARLLGVHRQSVASWLHAWEAQGLCGLIETPRSGRPKRLDEPSRGWLFHLLVETWIHRPTVVIQGVIDHALLLEKIRNFL